MLTEQQEKWLTRVEEMFFAYGVKSITMDDVARELGISKKTLYQFVENKNDLVTKVLERHIGAEKVTCAHLSEKAGNAVEEMLIVMETNSVQMQQMKSNIVYDLQKYHREAWEKVREFTQVFLYDVVRANLERGVAEGLYRPDFNVDIVAKLHIAQSLLLFDENLFPGNAYKKDELFREYLLHYLYGILTEKGLKVLKTKIS